MTQRISTLEVRQRLGDILNRVALRHDEFIVERKGKALAAVVPVERLEQMRDAARTVLGDYLKRPRAPISQSAADRLADEARHAVRPSTGLGAGPQRCRTGRGGRTRRPPS